MVLNHLSREFLSKRKRGFSKLEEAGKINSKQKNFFNSFKKEKLL